MTFRYFDCGSDYTYIIYDQHEHGHVHRIVGQKFDGIFYGLNPWAELVNSHMSQMFSFVAAVPCDDLWNHF